MEYNEILASLRYALHIKNAEVRELITAGGGTISAIQVVQILHKDDHAEYLICTPAWLHQFLDGLTLQRRGPREGAAPQFDLDSLDNNMILRKIRIAFELKDTDIIRILKSTGFNLSKSELGAMSRKKGHVNYMKCGDQLLRYLLRGLAKTYRPEGIIKTTPRGHFKQG